MIVKGNRLLPEEGKVLTNGDTYSTDVTLGKYDSVDNWVEVERNEEESIVE